METACCVICFADIICICEAFGIIEIADNPQQNIVKIRLMIDVFLIFISTFLIEKIRFGIYIIAC